MKQYGGARQRSRRAVWGSIFCVLFLLISGGFPERAEASDTGARSYEDDIATMERISGRYGERALIEEALRMLAADQHTTVEEVAHYEAYLMEHGTPPPRVERSGGSEGKEISFAENIGDFFYTPGGVGDHGHTGIFTGRCQIVEAVKIDKSSRMATCHQVFVQSGAVLRRVNTVQQNRDRAANRARQKYVRRGYNVAFWDNKNETRSMNCSQIVWAAYRYGTNIDLDTNGGSGVYPKDLLESTMATTYKTIW